MDLENLTNEELANAVDSLSNQKKSIEDNIFDLKREILKRMTGQNSNALPTQGYTVSRKITKYTYNTDNLYAELGELLTPEELSAVFVEVPTYKKVDGVKLRSLMSQHGQESNLTKIILSNRDGANPVLQIKKTEEGYYKGTTRKKETK